MEKIYEQLFEKACLARSNSYCPYSNFSVGAVLLCEDGSIFTGTNIENSSFSLTNCAERTAIFTAVSQGFRKFSAIAIAGGKVGEDSKKPCYPCGACRQVMSEFCDEDFKIVLADKIYKLSDFLPFGFKL